MASSQEYYAMNFSLKKKNAKGKIPLRLPVKRAFSHDDSENEDETADQQMIEAMNKKKEKMRKQATPNNHDMAQILETFEKDSNQTVTPSQKSHSKYIQLLENSKRQREKDQMIAKLESMEKKQSQTRASFTFESEAYRSQKEALEQLRLEETLKNEGGDKRSFYKKLLDDNSARRTEARDDIISAKDTSTNTLRKIKNISLTSQESNSKNNDILKRGTTTQNPKQEELSHSKITELIKELIRTKVSQADITEYRDRYLKRCGNRTSF